ncbi:MAG: hypothetical protein ABI589_00250 [Burkholderiales bacterium]
MIGWFYLVTNAARIFTYLPQIAAVWRSTDGARAISLFTWCSWLVSHGAAVLYGTLVMHDLFFVLIALINLFGCGCVTLIAFQRRQLWRREQRRGTALPRQTVAPQALVAANPPVLVAHPLMLSSDVSEEDGADQRECGLAY